MGNESLVKVNYLHSLTANRFLKRSQMLITIEDEKNVSERHFPRNYRKIFDGLGMKQVYEKHLSQNEGLNKKFYARVFAKQ